MNMMSYPNPYYNINNNYISFILSLIDLIFINKILKTK